MATTLLPGLSRWSLEISDDNYRTYRCTRKVKADRLDGPRTVRNTPGLPLPGSQWNFGNDLDAFCWCRPVVDVRAVQQKDEATTIWELDFEFSNRPRNDERCMDQETENPLMLPQQVSGSFSRGSEVATHDMWGDPITNSAHEMLLGDQVTFDVFRPTVRVSQNVPILQLDMFAPMVGTVNVNPLWGLPARAILLTNASWTKKFWSTCAVYWERVFDFDIATKIDPNTGIAFGAWDRDLIDEGSRALKGHLVTVGECEEGGPVYVLDDVCGQPPNPDNPLHYVKMQDANGNPMRVILDGNGLPAEVDVLVRDVGAQPELGTGTMFFGRISTSERRWTNAGKIHVQVYKESNFLNLSIPVNIGV